MSRLILVSVGIVLGLFASELLIRASNGARYGDRPVFYPPHDELGWSPASQLDHTYYGGDYSIRVATDEDGYRLGALGAPTDDAPRVLLVGDSYTFGWGVSTHETFASYLDQILAPSGRTVNLGVSGYGTIQTAIRLEHYFRDHDAPVRAIVLLHSHNDPSDNVTFESVRRGLREYVESPRNRGLHLHNLLRFTQRALVARSDGARAHTLPGGHRDFLWTVGAFPTQMGKEIRVVAPPEPGSLEEVMWVEQEVLPTYERASLTRLQRQLLTESIGHINSLAEQRGIPVVHATIHDAPSWYVEPLRRIVGETTTDPTLVRWCGRVPADTEYSGPEANDHSGSHFTPELNRYYAAKLASWIDACP